MTTVMHFYTIRTDEPATGYSKEGVAGHVYPGPYANAVPLYRWRHPESNHHFYTTDQQPLAGWASEGEACHVPTTAAEGAVPLYRWFNPNNGDHFYTRDPDGELAPGSGYKPEGIACHVFAQQTVDSVPLYRWAAGTQIWCVRLSRHHSVVFEKNFELASYEEAIQMSETVLAEYNQIHRETPAEIEPPKLGGC